MDVGSPASALSGISPTWMAVWSVWRDMVAGMQGTTGDPHATRTERRVDRRSTSRVLLTDPDGRVLLLHDSDPLLTPSPTFWITVGGALDAGESPEQAAVRETHEETGLRLAPADVRGPIAERFVVHGYSDRIVKQNESFFVADVPHFEIDQSGLMPDEVETHLGFRWWSEHELRNTSETVWPVGLADLLTAARNGATWPIQISSAEESTLPVGPA